MSEFVHSEILFSSDDGIPLEFNIQYVKDKDSIKSLIEHGGGICTLKEDVIHIVSPGATVLNVKPGINLVSTSYIYDCVKHNYLIDIDEYRFLVNEMETSDISDNSQSLTGDPRKQKGKDDIVNNAVDVVHRSQSPSPDTQTCPRSNHDFDFQDSENPDNPTADDEKDISEENSMQPVVVCLKAEASVIEEECNKAPLNADHSESLADHEDPREVLRTSDHEAPRQVLRTSDHEDPREVLRTSDYEDPREVLRTSGHEDPREVLRTSDYEDPREVLRTSDSNQEAEELNDQNTSANEVVSSSQPDEGVVLDLFDNMVLKAEENPVEKNEELLSQSDTVSSSADAQVSPKEPSNTSAEIFNSNNTSAPDSASQTTTRQQYINDLEKEIEQILQKPSPKSIHDKTILVKYICTVKKISPAIVLQTLQNF